MRRLTVRLASFAPPTSGTFVLDGRNTHPGWRHQELRRGRKVLGLMAYLVQWLGLAIGVGGFLDQARALLSDAQFTWGERMVMGLIAIVALGGCGLAGWILARMIRLAGELTDVLADAAEAAWRTNEMIEGHVIPALIRIASAVETTKSDAHQPPVRQRPTKP